MRDLINIVEGRLDELHGYRGTDEFQAFQQLVGSRTEDKTWESRKGMLLDFVTFLRGKGFKPLGHGAFGAVFDHPALDYAIKIFRNDPAYLKFAQYAQAHKTNPYLPKFRGRFMRLDRDNYVVRMEKLTPMGYNSDTWYMLQTVIAGVRDNGAEDWLEGCQNSVPSAEDIERLAQAEERAKAAQRAQDRALRAFLADDNPENQQAYEEAVQQFQAAASDYRRITKRFPRDRDQRAAVQFSHDNPLFCKTIEAICDMSDGFKIDMHAGNFMLRDGLPVITDPLASSAYL